MAKIHVIGEGYNKRTTNDDKMVETKIELRIQSLPDKKEIKVLEAFGGEGVLWDAVKRRCPDKEIKTLSIDTKKYSKVQLQGDNRKFLHSLNLNEFDIIDLDAYGMPTDQLEILFNRQYKGIVHCTFIDVLPGISRIILTTNGYTKRMIQKCPMLFVNKSIEKFYNYLAVRGGVKKVRIATMNRKNYLWFNLRNSG